MEPYTRAFSFTSMTEFVLPTHANVLGNVFGGQILAWMDICAAICAQRHASCVAVTVAMDDLYFEKPIKVGQVVRLEAFVTATFHSSMEIEVRVLGENPMKQETWPCVRAYVTFAAIDEHGKKKMVPPLRLQTEEEKIKFAEAQERRVRRLKNRDIKI